MGETLKSTFYDVPKRPLGGLPAKSAHVAPKFYDIPRGSVRDRIHFFERLKEENATSSSPPRRQTADSVFTGRRLNEIVELREVQEENKETNCGEKEKGSSGEKGETIEPLLTRQQPPEKKEAVLPRESTSFEDSFPLSPTNEPIPRSVPVAVFPSLNEQPRPAYEFTLNSPAFSDMELKSYSSLSGSTAEPNRSEPVNKERDIDAICVNCLEYVTLTDVDDHSLMCFHPAYGDLDSREEVSLKIKKLHRAINRRMKMSAGEKLMTLMRLREITVELTKNEQANLARLELELDDLAVSSMTLDGGLCCSVLARRLGNLLNEKEMESNASEVESHYNAEAERQRRRLMRWKTHTQAIEELQSPHKAIEEVKSDIGSDIGSAASSASKQSQAAEESDVADLQSAEEGLRQVSEDQLKKYFYSMCLKHKLLMPKTHPGQKVLVSGLFKEARRMDLPLSMWEKFITERLGA